MAVAEPKPHSEPKVWNFFKLPFRHSSASSGAAPSNTTSSHSYHHTNPNPHNPPLEGSTTSHTSNSVSSVARSLLPTRHRLKLDPSSKLFFPCMPSPLLFRFSFRILILIFSAYCRDILACKLIALIVILIWGFAVISILLILVDY